MATDKSSIKPIICPGVLAITIYLDAVFYIIAPMSLLKLSSHVNPTYGIPFIMYLGAPFEISRLSNNFTTCSHFCARVAQCAASLSFTLP